MTSMAIGWDLSVERGPGCLFIRVHPPTDSGADEPQLADTIWTLMQQHLVERVVLELDQLRTLPSYVIGQLVLLHKRVATQGGLLRVCGLSASNHDVLRTSRLDARFPNYRDRLDAVNGFFRPAQAR